MLRVGSHYSRTVATVAAVIGSWAALAPGAAQAAGATYYVARGGSDTVACAANTSTTPFASVQRALACAGDGDVISLAANAKPYPGIGTVTADVTIKGISARSVTVDAGQAPLTVAPGANVTLSGATLKCATNCAGQPTITDRGSLLLTGDSITANTGIPTSAILDATPDNSITPAALTIEDTTISGNDSKVGGAIQTNTGANATGATMLTVVNSTISDNVSLSPGGGISALATAPGSGATIANATIAHNTASGAAGVYASSPVALSNTIIAANTAAHNGTAIDCQSSSGGVLITDGPGGHNLIGNATGCGAIAPGTNGDQTAVSRPGLLALANNGGSVNTIALQSASPAIAAADPATCQSAAAANLDQRGHVRTTATRGCDIGAYDTGGTGGTVHARWYVAPSGSDGVACTANASTSPFATLQRAIACAGDGDVITEAATGTTPYPGIGPVGANLTFKGASAKTVAIDAGQGQLAVAAGANVILSGATLKCVTGCAGQPTITNEGSLQLSSDAVTGNTGIPTSAILTTTPDNSATSAALTVQGSTLSGNDSKLGGAIQTNTGANATGASTLTVANSTIAGNLALTPGGGIAALAGTPGSGATITNSTITGNTASGGGGVYASSPVALTNTIIATNTAHSSSATDCQSSSGGTVITDGPGGHNLIGDTTGCGAITSGTGGDQGGSSGSPLDPRLGPLAYNGGTTENQLPLSGSPALSAGSAASCLQQPVSNLDQRRHTRNAAARDVCDVGADDTAGTVH